MLELLRDGRSNESVAEALGVSLATARFHVSEIIGKLGVTNRHEAATWQPQPTADRPPRAWILAPIAAAREIRWSTVGVALGATATAAALALLALLIWGVSRTFSVSSSDAAAICTPGPTPPSSTLASEQRKTPLPPDLRPDSTRQAEIDQALQRNRDWSRRFIAAGCDPHALPDFANEQYQGLGYGNPDQVVADADVIVRAHVDATSFSIDDSRDTPLAHASVTVVENLKGTTANTLILNEEGGPIPQPYWGALFHLDGLPLLLTGDEVIVFLKQDRSSGTTAGLYYPISYVGIYYVRDQQVWAGQGNPCAWAIDGTPMRRFVDVVSATARRTASGQVSAAPSCGDFKGTASATPEPTTTSP